MELELESGWSEILLEADAEDCRGMELELEGSLLSEVLLEAEGTVGRQWGEV